METTNLSAEMAAAAAEAARVVGNVPEGTLSQPTPCGECIVGHVAHHAGRLGRRGRHLRAQIRRFHGS